MPDIFISYKREDQPFAETLHERLIAWGHSVWMDVHNIPAGSDWALAIEKGLNAAHTVIGVMSPLAVQAENVRNEWQWAIVHQKRLIPIMLDTCDVPLNLIRLNYINFTQDHESGFTWLKTALESPPESPTDDDPHLDYLKKLYERINTMLAHKIIKLDEGEEPQPIDLVSQRTRGAVDVLFEQQDKIDPFFEALGIEDQQQPAWESGDFRAAYDHFDGRVLLLGEPGAGKTITLLHFGRDAVVQRVQDRNAPLPILALISTWDSLAETSLADWGAGSYGAPPNAKGVIESGRALLLLDGLDELGGEREDPATKEKYDPRERFIAALTQLPQNQVIITCRVRDYDEIGTQVPLAGAVTLQNLSDAQIQNYLNELPDLWAALEADDQLSDIARTPLLLSIFAFAYRDMTPEDAAKLRDLTDSPGDLRDAIFERYVHERYAHEERKLRLRREALPFTLGEIYDVLGQIAFRSTQMGLDVLFLSDFRLTFGKDEIKVIAEFIDLMIKLNLLVQIEEKSPETDITFRFPHALFRDTLAYRHVLICLGDTDSKIRENAVFVLRNINDSRAVELLITALKDVDEAVRRNAAFALGAIRDVRAIEPLITATNDADEAVRGSADYALSQIEDTRTIEQLIATIKNVDEAVRRNAANVMGKLGDVRAVEPLIVALCDADSWVRSSAAQALGCLGDVRAVEPLIAALDDAESWVRTSAISALGKLRDTRAAGPLIVVLGDAESSERSTAAGALGQLGEAQAVEPLIVALGDADDWVRRVAAEALGNLGEVSLDALLKTFSESADLRQRNFALYALAMIGHLRALETFQIAQHDDDPLIRLTAISILHHADQHPDIAPLVTMLADMTDVEEITGFEGRMCDLAVEILRDIGTPEALTAVVEARFTAQSLDPHVRRRMPPHI
ncbi:MAG: HEAT repeat domain-containing protein [Anaerolineae bacterium]|nr:HEAT repeat domain-containing protein [Anaerolineae bacterium]